MKTRIGLGLSLLLLLLAMGIGSMVWVDHTTTPVAQELKRAALLVEQGEPEKGEVLARKAEARWQERWKGLAALLDHEGMDKVDEGFARIRWYAGVGDHSRMGAACAGLSRTVQAAGDDHCLAWWDLL